MVRAGGVGRRLPPMPTIGDLLRLFQLRARKDLGQNFLLDLNVTDKMVRRAGRVVGGNVCEIGPGPGGLTRSILRAAPARLCLVEKDGRFVRMMEGLKEAYGPRGPTRIHIEHTDVLRWELGAMWGGPASSRPCPEERWQEPPPNNHIIANLPFNVATPLLIRFLELVSERSGPWSAGRCGMTLIFQREVGERMVAEIGEDERCRLSAIVQCWAEARLEFLIRSSSFTPAPEVEAAVVHLEPLAEPLIRLPFRLVEKFFRHLFHYPNKQSIKAAMTLYPAALAGHMANEVFRTARVDPTMRAGQISNEELRDMAHVYEEQCRGVPGLFLFDYRRQRPLEELAQRPDAVPPLYPWPDDARDPQPDQPSPTLLTLSQAAQQLQQPNS